MLVIFYWVAVVPDQWLFSCVLVLLMINASDFLQDYHWWWRSFLTSGFTAVYLFGYCIHYFVSKLEIHGAASTFLYFGYTFIIVFLFFLLTGEIELNFPTCNLLLAHLS
jgi:hypothetical protein